LEAAYIQKSSNRQKANYPHRNREGGGAQVKPGDPGK
jgi:hypothetical protein